MTDETQTEGQEYAYPKPEPGQMWVDPDDRAVHQEFTILAVVTPKSAKFEGDQTVALGTGLNAEKVRKAMDRHGIPEEDEDSYILAKRGKRLTKISMVRLTSGKYRYMGRAR